MSSAISKRLLEIVEALPVKKGMRILEIGCGTGVAARAITEHYEHVFVMAIDRSAKAIEQALKNSTAAVKSGNIKFIQSKVEDFELPAGEALFDIAFAIRVGALDGRHPEIEKQSFANIKKALKKNGVLYIDGGDPLKKIMP